jgi:hypothetical protein
MSFRAATVSYLNAKERATPEKDERNGDFSPPALARKNISWQKKGLQACLASRGNVDEANH